MSTMTRSTRATPSLGLCMFYASMVVQNSSAFGTVALHHPPSTKNDNAALFLFPSSTRSKKSSTWTTRRKAGKRPRISEDCFGAAGIHTTATATSTTTALACQLLGMNCATPTDFSFSFKGFCRRGGETDVHADGWGLAVYEDSGLRQFHDVQAASESPMAKFLSNYPIRTLNMMGHIRYATVGRVNLSNVHPFSREMWGIQWCFCHNGEVPMFKKEHDTDKSPRSIVSGVTNGAVQHQQTTTPKRQTRLESLGTGPDFCEEDYYHPIGTTDSEALFCAMLNALRARFQTLPSLPALYAALQTLSNEAVAYDPKGTILNYLLSCGQHTLWAYSCPGSRPGSKVWNGLYYTVREYPFSNKCSLTDLDLTIDFTTVTAENDCVSVIATAPLTDDEEWREIKRGELLVFDQGKPVSSSADLFRLELLGHGLHSTVLSPPILEDDMMTYNFEPQEFLMGEGI